MLHEGTTSLPGRWFVINGCIILLLISFVSGQVCLAGCLSPYYELAIVKPYKQLRQPYYRTEQNQPYGDVV